MVRSRSGAPSPHARLGELNKAFAAFHKQYPWITVKSAGETDPTTKLTAAIRGGNAPDAVALFETDTLGAFCASGAWIDLSFPVKSDRVNLNLFPKRSRDYTAYREPAVRAPASRGRVRLLLQQGANVREGGTQVSAPGHSLATLRSTTKKLTQRDDRRHDQGSWASNPLMNW